jgi:hypothetical protein
LVASNLPLDSAAVEQSVFPFLFIGMLCLWAFDMKDWLPKNKDAGLITGIF